VTGTFKANNPYNTFLLLVYGLLLKLPVLLQPKIPQPQAMDGFLYKLFLGWIKPFGSAFPVIYGIITFILLYTQAIGLNKVINDLRLMQKPNYLTAMSYLLITSLFTDWHTLSSPLIANSFIIWVWARMSSIYNDNNAKTALFNIGLAIGCSTFFYFPSLAFSALVIFGLAITRPFRLAEWVITLFGIITPYYFLMAIVFLTDSWKGYTFPGVAFTLPKFVQTKWAYVAIAIMLVTAAAGFLYVQQNFRRQLIQARKSWTLVFLFLLVSLCVPFINATSSFNYWILCAPPLAALTGAAFLYSNKKIVPLIMHWAMVAIIIVVSYFAK
jgi:hypothetical protein